MKLEKRSSGAPEQDAPKSGQGQKPEAGKKPVVVYIMILFIVAFILMAVSFVMHQRSNSEVIGRLQDSVSALQAVQATQDENVRLQEQIKKLQDENADLHQQLDTASAAEKSAQDQAAALTSLYTLQQQYAAGDLDACRQTISSMETAGLDKLLPSGTENGVTTPAQRYLQLREAVENQ